MKQKSSDLQENGSHHTIVLHPEPFLRIWTLRTLPIAVKCAFYYCLSVAGECVLPERCTTPVWEEQDEPAGRSFDSGTYEHPASPPFPPHPSSEHTITTSLSTMTSFSDYSSASSSQDSGSELSSPTGVSSLIFKSILASTCLRSSLNIVQWYPSFFFEPGS